MRVQHLTVIGEPFGCDVCSIGTASVALRTVSEGTRYTMCVCDLCWQGMHHAYNPVLQGDEHKAVEAVARMFGDDEQKAGVKA